MLNSSRNFAVHWCFAITLVMLVVVSKAVGQPRFRNGGGQAAVDSPQQLAKAAVPDAASQETAGKLLREIYGNKLDGATSAEEPQVQLAHEFLGKVPEMRNDPASSYVLLREAGRLAFKARDYDLSFVVIDVMDKRFAVDALSMRVKVMIAEAANTETSWQDKCEHGFLLMKEAVTAGRFELALQMGALTQKAAEQSEDPAIAKSIADYRARLEKSLEAANAEKDLLARLNASPTDPSVNLAVGKLYCISRGEWVKGLPMLALGDDSNLKRIAAKDLESPSKSEDRLRLADDWWGLAQKTDGRERTAFLARSKHWYQLAQPGLSGLSVVKVEKRLSEIGTLAPLANDSLDVMADAEGFRSRTTGLRTIALATGGGTRTTEQAVIAALAWLAKHQQPDGSWSLSGFTRRCSDKSCTGPGDVRADAGATALGLLPFLAAGQTHKSEGPYKVNIRNGLGLLIRHQQPDGNLAKGADQMMYSHGMATMTLCEAYGLTTDKEVGRAAQRAVNFIVAAQNPADGGWRYNPRDPGDTSVVGWQLMALKSAHMAGLDVRGSVFSGTSKWLDSVAANNGTEYCYQPGTGASPTMTSVGLLCRQYLGASRDNPMLAGGMAFLMENLPDEGFSNVYYWYYATQVMHNMSGYEWDTWNRKMRDLLISRQVRKFGQCAYGSWSPEKDAWGRRGGRVMQTSLSALTLEVYYRYPPLFKAAAAAGNGAAVMSAQGKAKPPDGDDKPAKKPSAKKARGMKAPARRPAGKKPADDAESDK